MKRISISLLALTISLTACSTVPMAENYNDRDSRGNSVQVVQASNQYSPASFTYEREECWNEQTNVYDNGYYRDRDGRLYRGDSRNNTGGILLGALIGGALGHTVGKGDGRTAATIGGAVIGGAIGAHAGNDNDDYNYRDDSGVVRRCRTIVTTDAGYNNP